jgi:hypothetical protein
MGSLRERREAVVREHMESENEHDFDTTLATFDHPRYEIVPTGDVHDGREEVAAYFRETRTRDKLTAFTLAKVRELLMYGLLARLGPERSARGALPQVRTTDAT